MDSRREFIRKAAFLSGGAGLLASLPLSVQKALAINPDPGTTYENAEHIVLLMQENRSFDHCYGTLQGVRGFNDPRAIRLPNKNLIWMQTNKEGETYIPFRLDINDTKATWMSSLPHSWASMVDARNNGHCDRWLDAKKSGNKEYAKMPLTLGYYNREDLPFYYGLADAFTVCDHHFCSCLTGTTPNRLYYWTGTIRDQQNGDSPANVDNSFVDYDSPASWKTFPERLEENGVSWKIYQNELSVGVGFEGEEDSWLGNFTDNPIEWFTQYHVRFLPAHVAYLKRRAVELTKEIDQLKLNSSEESQKKMKARAQELQYIEEGIKKFSQQNFAALPEKEQQLHKKAFVTNVNDPDYHELVSLKYSDNGTEREMSIPKGDVLFQFREDVKTGQLPTVSWLVAPSNFSDHPGAPWYGAWYISEVMDILTKNPEVWKKTIFILTYDENDGYFDHVPPFVAPYPGRKETGTCSGNIDTTVDYVTEAQAEALKGKPKDPERVSPVGLGYRVPFVVASPWSRGGWVNSEVFDNTSVLMFLEKFLSKKTGKIIKEENISPWRRMICGDLTSVFRPYHGEKIVLPQFIEQKPFVEHIYNAQFKKLPSGFSPLNEEEVASFNQDPYTYPRMAVQEKGIRSSCALPYQLYAEGKPDNNGRRFVINLQAGDDIFKDRSMGAPFTVYEMNAFLIRNYAVAAGDKLEDTFDLNSDAQGYHFCIYGPNGFFREFKGMPGQAALETNIEYDKDRKGKLSGNIILKIKNRSTVAHKVSITDNAYKMPAINVEIPAGHNEIKKINLKNSHHWYDLSVKIGEGKEFENRYTGHVETGEAGLTDPFMGGMIS